MTMPTKIRITKEMILDAAFDIVRESDIEALSNREIAARLNCSIMPIYYQFANAEELQSELYKKIRKYFYDYILGNMVDGLPPYKQLGLHYINFARTEKNLFKVLFMSKHDYEPVNLVTNANEYNEIAKLVSLSTDLDDEEIKQFHSKMWIFTHGIATIVANEPYFLNDDEIQDLLSSEFKALLLLEKVSRKRVPMKNEDDLPAVM